jgi:hypothetical protein
MQSVYILGRNATADIHREMLGKQSRDGKSVADSAHFRLRNVMRPEDFDSTIFEPWEDSDS